MATVEEPVRRLQVDRLPVEVYGSREAMGAAAAAVARDVLVQAIKERGEANLILATGNSQLSFLHALAELPGIAWDKVRVFHMDEYLGIEPTHPASFPLFLRQHILDRVKPGEFYPVPSQPEDVQQACAEYANLLRQYPADLVALGFGENGHLAFNDPPYAKFNDPEWVKVVALDETSRRQQVGEGHFPTLDSVPTHAITLTVPALLAAKRILAIVPEARKVNAVRACLYEPISEDRPGSILRTVDHATLYLDPESAAGLES
jgi:glucosamine-6-phosphate deaminase